jgi:hypothetical protein
MTSFTPNIGERNKRPCMACLYKPETDAGTKRSEEIELDLDRR